VVDFFDVELVEQGIVNGEKILERKES